MATERWLLFSGVGFEAHLRGKNSELKCDVKLWSSSDDDASSSNLNYKISASALFHLTSHISNVNMAKNVSQSEISIIYCKSCL